MALSHKKLNIGLLLNHQSRIRFTVVMLNIYLFANKLDHLLTLLGLYYLMIKLTVADMLKSIFENSIKNCSLTDEKSKHLEFV
jgi:hypothetical protein